MYFKHVISINLFGCLLFSQLGELKAGMLTLQLWSSSARKMVQERSIQNEAGVNQYFYKYTYTATKYNDVVNLSCKANNSLTDHVLMWQIEKIVKGKNDSLTGCKMEHPSELNYVTNLNETHNGNRLTCIQKNATGLIVASAQVTFLCPKCEANETHFDAKCFSKSGITTYINGQLKNRSPQNVIAIKDEVVTVHFLIEIDDKDTVGCDPKNFTNPNFWHLFSKSVVVFNGTMSDSLDNQTISCVKLRDKRVVAESTVSVHFELNSTHYIEIYKSGTNRNTYREFTELPYNNNDTIKLTCYWTHKTVKQKNMKWVKGRKEVNQTQNPNNPVYEAVLTEQDDGSNITCENKIGDVTHTKTISLRYVTSVKNITYEKGNTVFKDQITHSESQTGFEMKDVMWTAIGIIAVIVIVVITVFVSRKCKTWRATAPKMNEISHNNFQNNYTAPVTLERPILEPTYAAPVDDTNMYAYTYNQKPIQETYSTPFVPTIEEMYTQPIPKSTKERKDPTYALPGKFTYANLKSDRQNQQEPGYSYVSRGAGDDVSETYTTATLYSRPR